MKSPILASIALLCFQDASAVAIRKQVGYTLDVKSFGKNSAFSCTAGCAATVNYTGKLENGTVFDSSTKDGITEPIDFLLGAGEVIPCWDAALAEMRAGEKATLTCPPDLAYGAEGAGPKIPPYATLTFDVEMVNCEPAN